MRNEKTDNHNLPAKLALRRHFLARYHAGQIPRVFDCCMGSGEIWKRLRGEHPCSYFGVDLKPAKGRLKIDSARILAQPGWQYDVIDVDTYGQPWKHWHAILQHAPAAVTVFLTLGIARIGMGEASRLDGEITACPFVRDLPCALGIKVTLAAVDYHFAAFRPHGFTMLEFAECENLHAHNGTGTRYLACRLEKSATQTVPSPEKPAPPPSPATENTPITPLETTRKRAKKDKSTTSNDPLFPVEAPSRASSCDPTHASPVPVPI